MGEERLGRVKHPAIVCRCRDVTVDDVLKAIEEGCEDLECLKRKLGIGMGPCQGRTCIPIALGILARKLGKRPEELALPTFRAPIIPIPVSLLLKSIDATGEEGGGGG